jgi:hypothetical protein
MVERHVPCTVPAQNWILERFRLSIIYSNELVFPMVGNEPGRKRQIGLQ